MRRHGDHGGWLRRRRVVVRVQRLRSPVGRASKAGTLTSSNPGTWLLSPAAPATSPPCISGRYTRAGPRMCPATGGERALHGGGRHQRGPGGAGGRFRPGAVVRCRYCPTFGLAGAPAFPVRVSARARTRIRDRSRCLGEWTGLCSTGFTKLGRHSEECCSYRAAFPINAVREDRRVKRAGCRIGREDATERERNGLRVKALAGERHRGRDERATTRGGSPKYSSG